MSPKVEQLVTQPERESAAPPKPPENDDDEYYDLDDETELTCPKCHGSGREWEGWECEYCDGNGFLDF